MTGLPAEADHPKKLHPLSLDASLVVITAKVQRRVAASRDVRSVARRADEEESDGTLLRS